MLEPKKNMIDISDPDAPIFRIVPILRALDLFSSGEMGLVRPILWDDPFENIIHRSIISNNGTKVDISSIRDSWYGQCWTKTDESDAMWRIYSQSKDGVRLKTTPRKIIGELFNKGDLLSQIRFFIGRVSYKSGEEITEFFRKTNFSNIHGDPTYHETVRSMLMKRHEFSHEDEIRLLIHDVERRHQAEKILLHGFDAVNLIDHVMLDPRLDSRIAEAYTQVLRKSGCKCPIEQSKLYGPPNLIIEQY